MAAKNVQNKICIYCKNLLSVDNFYFRKETSKFRNDCKSCNIKSRTERKRKTKHLRSAKEKELRKTNPQFRLDSNLRRRINHALKQTSKSQSALVLLGCTVEYLKRHLESLFKEGMNWDNYGLRGWHIDHIKPCSAFDLTDIEQQKQCFNYKNLQPLWCTENLKKGTKYATMET